MISKKMLKPFLNDSVITVNDNADSSLKRLLRKIRKEFAEKKVGKK